MKRLFLLLLSPVLCLPISAQDQQFAHIGDLKLENGEVIRDCAIGYRTFGTLNPQKDNAVLFPTYLGGRSSDLAGRIGTGEMIDRGGLTCRWSFILAVKQQNATTDAIPKNLHSGHGQRRTQDAHRFAAPHACSRGHGFFYGRDAGIPVGGFLSAVHGQGCFHRRFAATYIVGHAALAH